ncbi:MAG: sulfatase-like hydrolase/transferase [Candidatus Hydrogenedentes bacterium]|nr:sulfatase-like hydrolase/transferase [Candidatus Hydrogenedentota bacterium]
MKIVDIKTYLMHAGPPGHTGWVKRNWLFVKVFTDEGIYGVGEASGWPRVVQTAIQDLTPILIGEDPMHIGKLWQKMLLAIMGHGMTGTVGSGAMTGIEMALWDIKGKALNVPLWNLLGGKIRDRVRLYSHAHTPERARELVDRGFGALKTGGLAKPVATVDSIRKAVGLEIDLMVDIHGPPWLTTRDAIRLGRALEPYELLFYEDPVAPENIDALARDGLLFGIAISPVPMTLPSHSTMLTGTNPPYHGVHENVDYKLAPFNETLAEIMKANGFKTGAVVSGYPLSIKFGVNQGFDTYEGSFEGNYDNDPAAEQKGGETTRLALNWLDTHGGGETDRTSLHSGDRIDCVARDVGKHERRTGIAIEVRDQASQLAVGHFSGVGREYQPCVGRFTPRRTRITGELIDVDFGLDGLQRAGDRRRHLLAVQ